jgi:hypothetical protein
VSPQVWDKMPSIVFSRCPTTQRPAATTLVADLIGLARLLARRAEFICSECGATHVLCPGNAWLSLTHPVVTHKRKSRARTGSVLRGK